MFKPLKKIYNIPDDVGKGSTSIIRLSGGVDLKWSDMSFHESLILHSVVNHFHSEFNFCLEGGGSIEINGKIIDGCATAGRVQFIYQDNAKGEAYFPQGQRIRQLSIELSPRFWERIEIEPSRRFDRHCFLTDNAISIKSDQIIGEILGCHYVGHIRRLFLEGKAYELLALHMGELEPARILQKNSILSVSDIKAIQEAKRLIDTLLQTPPTLAELSRMIGINDFKLKLGFKQVYGTTVFGYIRDKRMHIARNLLERGECNVSQAALVVGYGSLPSFIRQFKKKYGCNPGECKPK
jgi:AraC-like DNA-binding protein